MNHYKHKTWHLDEYCKTAEEFAQRFGVDIKDVDLVKSFTDEEFIF